MKIAISVTTPSPEAPFETRFGRAAAFVIVDTETGERDVLLNPAADAAGGAGVQAAEFVIRHGAGAVISGAFGPNAYDTLTAAQVQMFQAESGTVDELVQRYKNAELLPTTGVAGQGRRRGRPW